MCSTFENQPDVLGKTTAFDILILQEYGIFNLEHSFYSKFQILYTFLADHLLILERKLYNINKLIVHIC